MEANDGNSIGYSFGDPRLPAEFWNNVCPEAEHWLLAMARQHGHERLWKLQVG